MVFATTGKPADEIPSATCLDCAKKKLAAYITVVPVLETPSTGSTGIGSGSDTGSTGSDTGSASDPGTGGTDTAGTDGSTDLGGCSTTGGTGGAMTFLLIGFAAFIRRRR